MDGYVRALTQTAAGKKRPAPAPARDGDRRRGIDRAIHLLEALLSHGAPMRPAEIARMLNAPRSTTYELVNRLVEAEMLEVTASDGSIYFGRAMHLFGHAYGQQDAMHRRLTEALARLAADASATAQVCTLRGNKYIVFDSQDGPGPFRITSDIGAEVPIPWTASGRLLLAHMSDAEIEAFIPPDDFMLPDGRRIAPRAFLDDVREASAQGYAETRGLADAFTHCLAAPIGSRDGKVELTLCLVLPIETTEARRQALITMLRERASHLSSPV